MFRPATMDDKELLYKWRNDSETINNSLTKRGVAKGEHASWFKKSLKDGCIQMFCILDEPIGWVRNNNNELSWLIAPERRGKGFGKKMLKEYLRQFPGRYEAKILETNIRSRVIAEQSGFFRWVQIADAIYYTN